MRLVHRPAFGQRLAATRFCDSSEPDREGAPHSDACACLQGPWTLPAKALAKKRWQSPAHRSAYFMNQCHTPGEEENDYVAKCGEE